VECVVEYVKAITKLKKEEIKELCVVIGTDKANRDRISSSQSELKSSEFPFLLPILIQLSIAIGFVSTRFTFSADIQTKTL
jgi:hypothetical protein